MERSVIDSGQSLLNNPDLIKIIAYRLPAKSILNLCISKKSINQSLCKNKYFLREITRKYFSRNPERFEPYTDILERLDEYNNAETKGDLLELGAENGYDVILYDLVDSNHRISPKIYNKLILSVPSMLESDMQTFFIFLDKSLVTEDDLRNIYTNIIRSKYYDLLHIIIGEEFNNAPYYDITETIYTAIANNDKTALKIILDEYGPDQLDENSLNEIYEQIINDNPDLINNFIERGFVLPNQLIYYVVSSDKIKGDRLNYFMNIWNHTEPDDEDIHHTLLSAIDLHDKHLFANPALSKILLAIGIEKYPKDNLAIIDFLSKKINLSQYSFKRNELRINMLKNRDTRIAEILISRGLDVDDNLLLSAASSGNKELVKYLLSNYKFHQHIVDEANGIVGARNRKSYD